MVVNQTASKDDDAKFYLPLVESNIDLVTGMLDKLKKRMK